MIFQKPSRILRTSPHSAYAVQKRKTVYNIIRSIVDDDLPFSYQFAVDLANVYSFVRAGEDVEDAFNVEAMEEPYTQGILAFCKEVNWAETPGESPLEKAGHIIKAIAGDRGEFDLTQLDKDEDNDDPQDPNNQEDSSDILPAFTYDTKQSKSKGVEVKDLIHKVVTQVGDKTKMDGHCKEFDKPYLKLTPHEKAVLDRMLIIKSRPQLIANAIPAHQKSLNMESYDQVGNLHNVSDIVKPGFEKKLITKNLMIKKNVPKMYRDLFLMIDDSGSMSSGDKPQWVEAIVRDRLEAVTDKKAVLYISFFESVLFEDSFIMVDSKEEAERFLKRNKFGNFDKGGTSVQTALERLCEIIKSGYIIINGRKRAFGGADPQIVLINDGQDRVDPKYVPKVLTHALMLEQPNKDLEAVCVSSGGSYELFATN
jgi:hypothetical protein